MFFKAMKLIAKQVGVDRSVYFPPMNFLIKNNGYQ